MYARREYRRYYPDAEVTSHLLGFTDIDDAGQEGLEKAFDAQLRGVPGSKRVIKDRLGQVVADVENIRAPQPGQSLALSIDRRLQYLAYRALKTAVVENKASAGAAVIVDVRSGEILAMVDQPAGNPNNRAELHGDLLRNRAITDVYEPGSTMKPFTVAMGLESGTWTPSTMVNTAPMRVGRYMVRDTHNYGTIDITHVISKSSNVGVSKIALSMPAERLWQLYKSLGFGASTGVGLTGEQPGVLRHFSKWGGDRPRQPCFRLRVFGQHVATGPGVCRAGGGWCSTATDPPQARTATRSSRRAAGAVGAGGAAGAGNDGRGGDPKGNRIQSQRAWLSGGGQDWHGA